MESSQSDKDKFIEWLKTGEKKPIGGGDGGFLIPSQLPINSPGWRAWFWRKLARVYLFFGLYGRWWMTYRKGVYFMDTIEWLKTGEKKPIGGGDGGFLIPSQLPINSPGWRAWFWRKLARVYLFFGLYGRWWMTYRKGVYFMDTIEYLKSLIKKG